MANPEHVKILKQGVEVWNKWRGQNSHIIPSLNKADLRGENLNKVKLDKVLLHGTDLRGANLQDADIGKTELIQTQFDEANLVKADLRGSKIYEAYFTKANLTEANLSDALFFATFLNKANLSLADLGGCEFRLSDLIEADLTSTELCGTFFSSTKLKGANLENSLIVNTIFSDINLSETKGLDKLRTRGHSVVDHQTLMLSKNLPKKFLRDCGFPEQLIDNLPSLLNSIEPIQFHSCFISYSSKDEKFAQRLHADLQAKGIRCWYAPEDMKIGDKIRPRIDEVIHLHEKLLLVLSEDSIRSSWVEKEVETAFEKESDREETVLFPIRLDDSVINIKTGWPADIKRARNIGDFRNWKDHDAYQKSFARLLRDLGKVE